MVLRSVIESSGGNPFHLVHLKDCAIFSVDSRLNRDMNNLDVWCQENTFQSEEAFLTRMVSFIITKYYIFLIISYSLLLSCILRNKKCWLRFN